MNRFKNGFTLIETLIVLVISALILSLSLLMTHHLTLNQFRDFFFWKRFNNQFELSENFARRQHATILVEFSSHGPVIFMPLKSRSIKERLVMPPSNLRPVQSDEVVINEDGHIDPKTIGWKLNNRVKVDQKFQLGWGMYNLEYK